MLKQGRIVLSDCRVVTAAGADEEILDNLCLPPENWLTADDTLLNNREGLFGSVRLPEDAVAANRGISRTCLLLRVLAEKMAKSIGQLKQRYSPHRVLVVIGTTTTGIREVESARSCDQVNYAGHQELAAVAEDLATYCGAGWPGVVVSTACTSGAKALGLARTLVQGGMFDAALAGGSEALTRLSCEGFESLESMSQGVSRPFQSGRDGINIGEGAALFVVERGDSGIALDGYAETADAWHESAPEPGGVQARAAVEGSLRDAGLKPGEIDYINLHGTGTRQNDAMEARVISEVFGSGVAASSTKPSTGHTLGAAGAIEAAILWNLLSRSGPRLLPPQHHRDNYDSSLPEIWLAGVDDPAREDVRTAVSLNFAFGGHNTSVVLRRHDA